MVDDITNEPRTAAEGYISATSASNLRIELHRTGAADYIGAAGMSPYHTGIALMRLRAEWDGKAKPKPPTRAHIEGLAATYKTEPADIDGDEHVGPRRVGVANPHAGLVECEQKGGRFVYRKPLELADEEAARWHLHELGLVMQGLKTLPEIRQELERWIGPPHAAYIVASVLAWWLDPTCRTCHGCGKRVVKNTGGRSSGKPCFACVLSPTPGHRPLPHAGVGRKLLAHILACYGTASKDQRSSMKERRSVRSTQEREQARNGETIERQVRADDEERADAQQDREAIARQFAMGRRKA